ncbi:MAG: 30S ribosomal protein S17 [Mycoplasmatales bacterium]
MDKAKRSYVGKVISTKMDKSITVLVEGSKSHPVYGKKVKSSKKYKAHDEENVANVGDKVRIEESRPLSATKRTKLVEIIEKGQE